MGLFDWPHDKIKKLLPEAASIEIISIESFVAVELAGLAKHELINATAFVLSVYAVNSVAAGRFNLSTKDCQRIQRIGMGGVSLMSDEKMARIENTLEKLMETDLIQRPISA